MTNMAADVFLIISEGEYIEYIVVALCLMVFAGYEATRCRNMDNTITGKVTALVRKLRSHDLPDWGEVFKNFRVGLSKKQYDKFKNRNVPKIEKSARLASNLGYAKIEDIVRQAKLKISGTVLSLASGKGGWDQYVAKIPSVTSVKSFTLGRGPGHQGHEERSPVDYQGKEKVSTTYADIRDIPNIRADFVLFDGGEYHPKLEKEREKFYKLFLEGVYRQVMALPSCGFILKVLTPFDPAILDLLTDIQNMTGKGQFYRSVHSNNATLELYFVSKPKGNLRSSVRKLLDTVMNMTIDTSARKSVKIEVPLIRSKVVLDDVEILEPLDMGASIQQLGPQVHAAKEEFKHWEHIGTYPVGSKGSTVSKYNGYVYDVIKSFCHIITGFMHWRATDTTPEGFHRVFKDKIDTSPNENVPHQEGIRAAYHALADHVLKKGFSWHTVPLDELPALANKTSTSAFVDTDYAKMGDFFADPTWQKQLNDFESNLVNGRPTHGIFNTIGKREKKYSPGGPKGSRMVAYLPIVARVSELRVFRVLNEVTHQCMSKFGVGGLGLHDLGERMAEDWMESGASSDIAGFDTRVGLTWLCMEHEFLRRLGAPKIVTYWYRLYAYPMILVVALSKFTRSWLLSGRGQRMSGSGTTYPMNTVTRIVLQLLQICRTETVDLDHYQGVYEKTREILRGNTWKGGISGDDQYVTSTEKNIREYVKHGNLMHDLGFPRKNMHRDSNDNICDVIEEMEFCSHWYEKVSYYDSYNDRVEHRYMPTRTLAEILAKATIWLGANARELDEEAWASGQGNNLLINYHHIRMARYIGIAIKSVVRPNITLGDKGGWFMRKNWMRDGEIMDIINDVLFGESTQYPRPGFRVRSLKHLGYIKGKAEVRADPNFNMRQTTTWRSRVWNVVRSITIKRGISTDLSMLTAWKIEQRVL